MLLVFLIVAQPLRGSRGQDLFFSSMRPIFTGTTRFIAFKTPNVKTLTVGRNAQGLWIDSEQLIPISILQELIELKDEIATILSILTGDVLLFTLELHR